MNLTQLNEKLSKVKILVMDVDGTLTDSAMYYSPEGDMLKRFSTRDGMGITLLHKNGIKTAIITSENSPIVSARAKKLQIEHVFLGCRNKTEAFKELGESLGITCDEMAYMGDDVNDYHVLQLAGTSACPSDATTAIRDICDYICTTKGGNGAVREFCELILKAQNKPIILNENW